MNIPPFQEGSSIGFLAKARFIMYLRIRLPQVIFEPLQFSTRYSSSNVDMSPVGSPNSLAFNNLLIILPLLVFGTSFVNSISLGYA